MEIDKQTLKALSVESRLSILKKLTYRRMLPSELSKRLGLAPSTVIEHLKLLEGAGLVTRKETGHKWIYYEITEKGLNIVKPSVEVRFVLTLVLGIGLAFVGFIELLLSKVYTSPEFLGAAAPAIAEKAANVTRDVPEYTPVIPYFDLVYAAILAAGILLVLIGLVKFKK